MLVCICKGLSERQVLSTIESGARTVEEIGRRCGAGTDCGTCEGALEAMLETGTLVRASRLMDGRAAQRRHPAPDAAMEDRQRDRVEAHCASPERDAA
jgi:bacterioferritin-associated ferredoxin